MIGMPLGCPWGPFFPSSVPGRSQLDEHRYYSVDQRFIKVKPTLRPRGGPGSMSGMPLGYSFGPFFSSSAPARFVFGLLWAPRSPFNSSPPFSVSTSHTQVPQGSVRQHKCTHLYDKTTDFARPLVCPKLSPRVPHRPSKVPRRPPRSSQGL